uniref:Uncharacterized protein n=1 Tax=Onchocerca volvulus TaxID=6282 RepID=A0A8R1XPI1_ONCVO
MEIENINLLYYQHNCLTLPSLEILSRSCIMITKKLPLILFYLEKIAILVCLKHNKFPSHNTNFEVATVVICFDLKSKF